MKRFRAGCLTGAVAVIGAVLLIGQLPVTSREGVGEIVKEHRLPLWEKAARFLVRDAEFRRMAEEAAGGEADPERRVVRLLEWTRAQVRLQPEGLPFIDDHISHIVLRHYGNAGQMAEVFTALTTYTGNEGRWEWSKPPGRGVGLVLAFVRSSRGWWVFDVANGIWFERPDGGIAVIEDFQDMARLTMRGRAPDSRDGRPYRDFYSNLEAVWRVSFSRAYEQMPWHRLRAILGLAPAS
jgi:hypothetical protein